MLLGNPGTLTVIHELAILIITMMINKGSKFDLCSTFIIICAFGIFAFKYVLQKGL